MMKNGKYLNYNYTKGENEMEIKIKQEKVSKIKNILFWLMLLSIPIFLQGYNYIINNYVLPYQNHGIWYYYNGLFDLFNLFTILLLFVYSVLAISYLYNKYIVFIPKESLN